MTADSAARRDHGPRLQQELWRHCEEHETSIYLVLDGARRPNIHPLVLATDLPVRCLYEGKLSRAMQRVAPYLIQLQPEAELLERVLRRGWGDAWGIFLESPAVIDEVRRHLRRFLKVQDEQGHTLLFRYYDPRVLRLYLPTCNEAERQQLFGPIWRFVLEDEDPEVLLDLRNSPERLVLRRVALGMPPVSLERAARAGRPLEYGTHRGEPPVTRVAAPDSHRDPPDLHAAATRIIQLPAEPEELPEAPGEFEEPVKASAPDLSAAERLEDALRAQPPPTTRPSPAPAPPETKPAALPADESLPPATVPDFPAIVIDSVPTAAPLAQPAATAAPAQPPPAEATPAGSSQVAQPGPAPGRPGEPAVRSAARRMLGQLTARPVSASGGGDPLKPARKKYVSVVPTSRRVIDEDDDDERVEEAPHVNKLVHQITPELLAAEPVGPAGPPRPPRAKRK